MVIILMLNGRVGKSSCTGQRSQRTVLQIASPRTITGLRIDLRRDNPRPGCEGDCIAGARGCRQRLSLKLFAPAVAEAGTVGQQRRLMGTQRAGCGSEPSFR
jgi:hypothetical protein